MWSVKKRGEPPCLISKISRFERYVHGHSVKFLYFCGREKCFQIPDIPIYYRNMQTCFSVLCGWLIAHSITMIETETIGAVFVLYVDCRLLVACLQVVRSSDMTVSP